MLFKSCYIGVVAFSAGLSALFTDIETGSQPELSISNLELHQSPPTKIYFRLPPTFQLSSFQEWKPTPPLWFLGTWYFSLSSSLPYQTFQDMQWTLYQTGTYGIDGTLQDLVTVFVSNHSSFVFKNYGIDTPTLINGKPVSDSFAYVPPSPLAPLNNTWEVISRGYDSVGVPYSVVYETPAYGGLATLDMIYTGIENLHNDNLTTLLKNVVELVQNGGRNGQLYPSCNATCQANADAFGVALGTGGAL